jgi:hypothetical protein
MALRPHRTPMKLVRRKTRKRYGTIFITGSARRLDRAAAQTLVSGHDVTVLSSSSTRHLSAGRCLREGGSGGTQERVRSAYPVPRQLHRGPREVDAAAPQAGGRHDQVQFSGRSSPIPSRPKSSMGPNGLRDPDQHWFRSEMGDFARDMLLSSTSKSSRFLKPAPFRASSTPITKVAVT